MGNRNDYEDEDVRALAEPREQADVKKLSRALIALAMAQAQAEADAEAEHKKHEEDDARAG